MKHAYLILAHNEFDILQCLIESIDDHRNDIYVHFDSKVKALPSLLVKYSRLYIIDDRVDVAWGDVSVVEAEYRLYESSFNNGSYTYYHLLSGVDLPLKTQDQIHAYFEESMGKEFIGFSTYDYVNEVRRKVNYYHLFPRSFRSDSSFKNLFFRIIRAVFLRIQLFFLLTRNSDITFKKGTQWASTTGDFVELLLINKVKVLQMYKYTFCPDEIYKQTICWNSKFRDSVFCVHDEAIGSMRMISWKEGVMIDWGNSDYEILLNSGMLFARKFNTKNIQVVNRILDFISK